MSNTASNNQRVAKNTLILYFRMLVTLGVSLYASRVVLQVLGFADYGLYNVVGGVVSLMLFLNTTLQSGTQRFLSYAIGKGDQIELKKVFSNSLALHIIIALLVLLVAETIGLWLICKILVIPEGRDTAAIICYQFSVFTSIITIIQVPFTSALIAHEKMDIYAYMSIYDVVSKLLIVFLIRGINFDKLILYSFFIFLVQLIGVIVYASYCRSKFSECSLKVVFDKDTLKKMSSFSGWIIIGMFASTTQGQGLNILLNIFFGTVVNAARGIAYQVNNVLMQFVSNFQVAAMPQIIKLYSTNSFSELYNLVINVSKLSALLFLCLIIPFYLDIENVLTVWLGSYPNQAPVFLRIIFIQSLFQALSRPIIYVTHATGEIKWPNIIAGTTILLFLPVSFLLLKIGFSAVSVLIINIIPNIVEIIVDLYFAHKFCGFPIKRFAKEVFAKIALLGMVMFSIAMVFYRLSQIEGLFGFILLFSVSVTSSLLVIFWGGLNKNSRYKIVNMIKSRIVK